MLIDDETMALYRAVKEAAAEKRPCPSNQELCAPLGRSERFVSDRLANLAELGMITLRTRGGLRAVTITTTGDSTADIRRTNLAATASRGAVDRDSVRARNIQGCRELLRRQLETGFHWINCPDRMAAACREAMPMGEAA